MTPFARHSAGQVEAARRIVDSMTRRAALNEAIGAVRAWEGVTERQAGARFRACEGDVQRDAEVARVAAQADAMADRRADPDWTS